MSLLRSVSKIPLSFGGAAVSGEGGGYGFGVISESDAICLLEEAFDRGLRIFDTAPIYGFGTSEKRIGKAFKKNRSEVFIISKSGVTWSAQGRVDMTNSPAVTEKMLEQSLRDLDTDYIDLYMIHWPDPQIDIRESLTVLKNAQEKGKLKHIGLCNTHLEDLKKAEEVCRVEVVQSEFNYFNSSSKELFPYLREKNISFMAWGPLDKGVLSGRVTKERHFDSYDMRGKSHWRKRQDLNFKWAEIEKIKQRSLSSGQSLLEFALSYPLQFPEVTNLICGMKSSQQLQEVIEAVEKFEKAAQSNRQ